MSSAHLDKEDGNIYLQVSPKFLSYGCICQGFVYHLTISLTNKSVNPTAIRLNCIPLSVDEKNRIKCIFEPKKIAPGMSVSIVLEYHAEIVNSNSSFELIITQGIASGVLKLPVNAYVVPVDIFKDVTKSLQLQKRPIYRNGIKPVRAIISTMDGSTILNQSTTIGSGAITENIMSEALMDTEDVEELLDMPFVSNVYWDPIKKKLIVDKDLGKVTVSADYNSIEESIMRTKENWNERMSILEDRGFYTHHSVIQLIQEASSLIEESFPQTIAAKII